MEGLLKAVSDLTRFAKICFLWLPPMHCKDTIPKIFPEKELRGLSPNFHIRVSVRIFIFPGSVCLFCSR